MRQKQVGCESGVIVNKKIWLSKMEIKTAGRRAFCEINECFYIVQESLMSLCLLTVASLFSNVDAIIWPELPVDMLTSAAEFEAFGRT